MRTSIRLFLMLAVPVLSIPSPFCRAEDEAKQKSYLLKSGSPVGHINRIKAELEVGGDLKLLSGGKQITAPMSVAGKVEYDEKLLEADAKSLANRRSVRYYSLAEATIKINKDELEPDLRDSRRIVEAAVLAGTPTLFSPQGSLSGEELDLIELPGNSLFLDLLLPGDEVKVGKSWQPSDTLIAAVLGIDAVSKNDVQCTLSEVQHEFAIVNVGGTVNGAIQGVTTELEMKARFRFDLKQQQITYFTMAMREKRSIGHVGPGLDVTAKLKVEITPLETSEKLTDEAVAEIKLEPKPELTAVEFDSTSGGFRLTHDRRWHPTNVQPATLVLRMVDRGELVAQCNVSSLAKLPDGKRDNLTDFRGDVQQALAKNFVQFEDAGQATNAKGFQVLHAYVQGKVQDLPIEWRYYLVSDLKTGRRMAFAFTLEQSLIDRLGTSDRDLIDKVELFEPIPESAAKPKATQKK